MNKSLQKKQSGSKIAEQAKEELKQLMDELFVEKLQVGIDTLTEQNSSVKKELAEKLDIQGSRLLWLQNELKKMAEGLPDQLKPLGVIVEVKDTVDELCEGLAGRLDSMENELRERLEQVVNEAAGEVSDLNGKLIQTVMEHHTDVMRGASEVINESFSQVAAAISTTAENLNSESVRSQTELQVLLDAIRIEQTARVDAVAKELEKQIMTGQDTMLKAIGDMEDKRKRHGVFGIGILTLQIILLVVIACKELLVNG
ncbi:hypothetical protein [Paenibacillus sp. PL2-23]|uniref:hypothetical protein n=1 Tax=Paenibacillus sp. PL2-23 TaxID=2100729 RepID=UPI0030F75F97